MQVNIQLNLANNFTFLFNDKIQVLLQKALLNLESLDNQALILIISQDLIGAYQREFKNLKPEVKEKVQKFILDVFS